MSSAAVDVEGTTSIAPKKVEGTTTRELRLPCRERSLDKQRVQCVSARATRPTGSSASMAASAFRSIVLDVCIVYGK